MKIRLVPSLSVWLRITTVLIRCYNCISSSSSSGPCQGSYASNYATIDDIMLWSSSRSPNVSETLSAPFSPIQISFWMHLLDCFKGRSCMGQGNEVGCKARSTLEHCWRTSLKFCFLQSLSISSTMFLCVCHLFLAAIQILGWISSKTLIWLHCILALARLPQVQQRV